jgi:Tfp pilus assembly ATPase PilU
MSTMERILRLMAEKKASDVYLSANAPALIKINGECVPINNQILPPEAPRNLLSEVVPPDRIEELEETGELNMGVPLSGVGRFRVSGMRQRGSYAVVIRFISQQIPELETLNLPAVLGDLILEKRGLILVVGATGSGKSTTLAAMLDRRNTLQTGHILTIEDPVEYQFRNKKSIINQREVGSDTQSLQVALKNALRSIVSQRLVRTSDGERVPAAEVMLNTKLVAELIENGDFSGVKDAMEKSMAEGSQTFEEDLARLIMQNRIDRKEGLAYADSPTNLMWRLQNDFSLASKAAQAQKTARDTQAQDEAPSFTEIVLDVRGGD